MDFELQALIKKEKDKLIENTDDFISPYSYDYDNIKKENEWLNEYCENAVLPVYQVDVSFEEVDKKDLILCNYYNEIFSDRYSLYKHNLKHLEVHLSKQELYVCNDCLYYNKSKSNLEEHISKRHSKSNNNKKTYSCTTCNKQFNYKQYKQHLKIRHDNFKCYHCKVEFECKKSLSRHILRVHWCGKCSECNRKFLCKSRLIRHIAKKHGEYKCPRCDMKFHRQVYVKQHIKDVHTQSVYSCNICKSTFKHKSYYLIHINRIHYDDGKMHICDFCERKFKSPSHLVLHFKKCHKNKMDHVLEREAEIYSDKSKNHYCNKCNKLFTYTRWLDHMMTVHVTPECKKGVKYCEQQRHSADKEVIKQ